MDFNIHSQDSLEYNVIVFSSYWSFSTEMACFYSCPEKTKQILALLVATVWAGKAGGCNVTSQCH